MARRYDAYADYLSRELGVVVQYVPSVNYAAVVTAFTQGELQLAFFGGLTGVWASGASSFRVFPYGRLPMALPDMLSYTYYRFECAVRSTAIMSFVGIRGLGYEIQLSLHDLLFNQVWTLMLFMVAMVVLVDLWSDRVRRSLVT